MSLPFKNVTEWVLFTWCRLHSIICLSNINILLLSRFFYHLSCLCWCESRRLISVWIMSLECVESVSVNQHVDVYFVPLLAPGVALLRDFSCHEWDETRCSAASIVLIIDSWDSVRNLTHFLVNGRWFFFYFFLKKR